MHTNAIQIDDTQNTETPFNFGDPKYWDMKHFS
jgi:hypothetical protein